MESLPFKELKSVNHLRPVSFGSEEIPGYEFQFPNEIEIDPILGWKHSKNVSVRHMVRSPDEFIIDAKMTFDEFRRRKNIIPYDKNKHEKFLALFGCSFTYGYGVNDNETLNHFINKHSKKTIAYNYAIGASGTNMMLEQIRQNDFRKQIPLQSDGDFIYVYIDSHIGRALGFLHEGQWSLSSPKYEWQNGSMVRKGSIEETEPIRQSFISLIRFLYQKLNIHLNFPPVNDSHYQYICDLTGESKKEWNKTYPNGRFIFYSHPTASDMPQSFVNCLTEKGVQYVRGKAGVEPKADLPLQIKYDLHPNSHANELIAKEILSLLEEQSL